MQQTFEIVGLRAVHENGDLKLFVDLAAGPEAFIRRERRVGGRPLPRAMMSARSQRLVRAHLARRPGTTQQVVLAALQDLSVVEGQPKVRKVVDETVERMPEPNGRDTRRQRAVRALELLARSGQVEIQSGRVVC